MKSKKNQRLLALILSMVLMLSASISAMAEGEMQTEASGTEVTQNQAEEQSLEDEASAASYSGETEVQESSAETGEEITPAESGETVQSESVSNGEQQSSETVTENGQITEETVEPQTDEAQPQAEEAVTEQPAETPEEILPEEVISEAAELKQEFTDENGNVTQTVTAYVPEGAFQATADQISMEVSLLDTDDTNYIKGMMEELLPENYYLDGYVLYQVDFKVNGEITQPAKAVTISMTGNDLAVEDIQKAHVFYYDPEDPEVEDDEDQLAEVIQKDQLIKSLEESGESTENIEDYDYSEIAVNEGNADTITVKGWESTIYGCYVEKEAVTELNYEDDSVTITVSADQSGIIPEGAELSVTPITKTKITDDMSEEEKAQAEEINAKYEFTEERLKEDSEEKEEAMEGFLAYDISFLVDGEEVEPGGDVKVVMDFKEAAIPEDVSEDAAVLVKHLKEDEMAEDGIVVEDMTDKAEVQTTDKAEVEKIELTTDSFSTYSVTWYRTIENEDFPVEVTSHYGYLDENEEFVEFQDDSYLGERLPDNWQNDRGNDYNGGDYYLSEYASNVSENSKNYYFIQGYVVAGEDGGFSTDEPAISISINDTNDNETNYYIYRQTTKDHWETVGEALKQNEKNYLHIYFVYKELTENPSLTINFVEKNGEAVDGAEPITISWDDEKYGDFFNTNGLNLEEYGTDVWCREGYYLIVARLDNLDGTDVGKIRYYDNKWGYTDESEGFRNWSGESNEREVYLIYGTETSDTLEKVETVEKLKEDYGISISMQNLDFKEEDAALDSALGGQYNSGQVQQGLVESTLESGYPETISGTSLKTLFNDGTEADNFFIKKTLEDEGYFEYSSFENYAYLDGDQFTIYNQMGAVSQYENAGETEFYFHRGNFLPYNDLTGEKSLYLTNLYDEDGNKIDRSDEKFGKQLYLSDGVDYHFSMQMTANFLQPEDGITDSHEEMVFEFNGDDDMWVYINDVLILDIGGEHDAHSGTINFATGVVTVNISATQTVTTSLNKLYKKAGVFPDGSDWDEEKINDYFVDTGKTDSAGDPIYRFKDYEKYTMKMFYMERGTGASNLHIRFNLQAVPDGSVTVAKKLSNTDQEEYANQDFQFQLYVKEQLGETGDGNPIYGSDFKRVTAGDIKSDNEKGIHADLRKNNASVEGGLQWMDKDGDGIKETFLLKPGQLVVFSGLKANQPYYVKEVGVDSGQYDGITINTTTVVEKDKNGNIIWSDTKIPISAEEIDVKSTEATVSERSSVTFTNNCDKNNLGELHITKKMAEGQDSDDSFTFQILFENTSGDLVPYTGEYYLYRDGQYWHYDETGELVAYEGTEDIKDKVCGTTSNGQIGGVMVDDTVSIKGLLPGTQFHVYELTSEGFLDTDIYNKPTYAAEKADNIQYLPTEGSTDSTDSNTGVKGEISDKDGEENNASITVTNSEKPIPIDLKKYGSDEYKTPRDGAVFRLFEGTLESSEPMQISWSGTAMEEYENIPVNNEDGKNELTTLTSGYYMLKEVTAPVGYELLDEAIYFQIDEGTVKLITQNGNEIAKNETEMWKLKVENGTVVLKIKNKALYELPSAGGSGIFRYMIGGTLLLMAGSLMIYINRRRGVLRR